MHNKLLTPSLPPPSGLSHDCYATFNAFFGGDSRFFGGFFTFFFFCFFFSAVTGFAKEDCLQRLYFLWRGFGSLSMVTKSSEMTESATDLEELLRLGCSDSDPWLEKALIGF